MATGTKLMKEINDQFLICKICFEPYKDPKTLVCLHTFCCDCLQKHTEAENSRPSRYNLYSRYVGCPLCRKKTEIPSGGIRNLQDNFLVSSLTEVINKRVCTKVPPCEICHTIRPRSNEACSKCLECNKLLCAGCVELHMTTKVTQKHSLIDIEGEKDIECKAHPEEIVRFYCEPCDACICVVCTFQEHRDHEICSFNEGFTKYKETLVDLLDKCKHRLGGVSDRVKIIDKYEILIKEIRERIRDIAIDYMTQVRAKERELMKKVDDLFGHNVMEFIQNKSWLQENLDNLQSTCNLTEIIMKDKGVEMMLLKRELQAKFAHLLETKLPDIPDDLPEDVRFIPGDVTLGHISIKAEDGEFESELNRNGCGGVTQSTQTVSKEVYNSTTSMNADMTISSRCGSNQTEGVLTSNRETNTIRTEFRDRGSNAYDVDTKTRGTMTLKNDTRTQKNQTDKVVTYDQTCMTSIPLTNGTNSLSAACDTNSSNNRQNRWIRSRKIQTDISTMGNTESDNIFSNGTLMNGEDRINGHSENNSLSDRRRRRDHREIHRLNRSTSEPKMVDKETSPDKTEQKDQCIMVLPNTGIIETQTPIISTQSCSSATDYEGQQHKGVSTVKISCVDSASGTPHVTSESKVTWTESTMTTERAMCTVNPTLLDNGTLTDSVKQESHGIQVRPKQRTVATNMRPCKTTSGQSQTDVPLGDKPIVNGVAEAIKSSNVRFENACVGTDSLESMMKSIDRLSFHCMESSTETLDVRVCDKETGTIPIQNIDKWTLTNKPQYMDTGVSPPTPATFDASVSTNVIITMEQATYTDVKTYRETGIATVMVSTDTETMTEQVQTTEAQTSVDIQTQDANMSTDDIQMVDEITMVELCVCKDIIDTQNKETQCGHSRLGDHSIGNSSLDTSFSNSQSDILECVRCEQLLHEEKQFIDSGTMPQKQETQEVGTMALSIYGNSPDVVDVDTQTNVISTKDKSVSAAFDLDEPQRNLKDYVDVSTSTESLPYIGLLSEIDVDDIIVFPQADFDLVSEYSSSDNDIEMVDDETSTDWLDGIETGTQTFSPPGTSTPVTEDQFSFTKNIGVNTHSKLTFEKETCTPIRHLFSKGTMTFYVSRTDKATSTSQSKFITEAASKFGGKVQREASVHKAPVSDKVTMTAKAKLVDASVETDPTLLDGKISECISKLRNVSDRLNSPTMRLSSDTEAFFGKGFHSKRHGSDSSELTSSFVLTDSSSSLNAKSSPVEKSEEERQKQLQHLLAETSRKSKDTKSGNKKEPKTKSKELLPPPIILKEDSGKQSENPITKSVPRSPTPIKSILKTSSKTQPQKESVSSPPTPVLRPRVSSSKTPEKVLKSNDISLSKKDLETSVGETKSNPQLSEKPLSKEMNTLHPPLHIEPSVSPVMMRKTQRKPQPITTLKGKKTEDYNSYKSRSLPRQFSTENSPLSALMIPTSPPSRLPLLRYNSAPGRIATVPTHTLLKKAGQSPPMRTSPSPRQPSPSKIPVSNRQVSPEKPVSEIYSSNQKSQKPHSRSPLPAISETRTPSSCSDSSEVSFLSVTSGESMTLSLTPSIGTISSETSDKYVDQATNQEDVREKQSSASSDPKSQQKKERTGFMQRLFSKKKKDMEQKPEIIHTNVKWTPPPKPPQEPPKVQIPPKSRPFVYVRSRIFSIQHDVEDEKKYLKEKEEEEKRIKEEERLKEAERRREEEKKIKKDKKEEKKSKTKPKAKKGEKPPSSPLLRPGKKTSKSSARETDSDLSDCQMGATSVDSTDVFK